MQITFENLSGLERKLRIKIPAEHIENKVKTKLSEIAVKAKMPGFRPGKIPFEIIKKNYTKSAHADVLENLLRETYTKALQQEKLIPAGLPDIKIVSSKPEEDFVYTAVFEVYPEIKIIDLKEAEVEKSVAQVTDSDVDEMIEKMRKSQATWQEISDISRKAQSGDQVTIDYTTKPCVTNEAIEPKTEKDVKFILGDGSMWVDFEQQLHGVGVSEEKQFILQMPDTHMDKAIAGSRVEFVVKLHKICEPILPALDDEFASKMNFKEGGMAKLKEEIRCHMKKELETTLKSHFKQAIINKLLEYNPIEVPKCLVEMELKNEAKNWEQRLLESRGTLENAPAFPRSNFEPQVKRGIALGLLISEIVKEHKIIVNHQEIRKKIEDLARTYYDDEGEVVNRLLSDQKRLADIEMLLLEDKVTEHLAAQVKSIEKNASYKDILTKR